jgi:hypothetical protein
MRNIKIITLLGLMLFAFAPTVRADYHYASHTGSNTYPYTSWETAADSIQKAINAASSDDTVYVGSGVWSDVPCTLWADLSLIGRGIDSTIIQKGNHAGILYMLTVFDRVIIQGITFDGINRDISNTAIGPWLYATGINIYENKFINLNMAIFLAENSGEIINSIFFNNNHGIDGSFDACNMLVRNCLFQNQYSVALLAYNGRWFIENNIFSHNPHTSLNLLIPNVNRSIDTAYIANNLFYDNYNDVSWDRLDIINCGPKAYLENNTVIGLKGQHRFIAALITSTDTSADLVNNIVTDFYSPVYAFGSNGLVRLLYNCLWNNSALWDGSGRADTVVGNIFRDPMFVDTNYFRLQLYSPCIDTGDPIILDYDGTRSDIGVFGGPGGRFYEYQDLPPQSPDSLSYRMRSDSIIISWKMNTEADFNRYIVWKDTAANFTPWAGNIISEPDTSYFIDFNWDIYHNYYYKIAAYDNQWNLSGLSEELEVPVTSVSEPENPLLPRMTEIKTNYPNPFNSQTTIAYTLSDLGYQPAEVKLYIYNISGQLVRKLVDTRQYPGSYNVVWDGLGEGGAELSSGIYFARLIVSGNELQRARKITLLK